MPKLTQKNPKIQYGIEITKPHSNEMYDHNDLVSYEMKSCIRSEVNEAHMRAKGQLAANGGMAKGEDDLRKIQAEFCGIKMGDGYSLEDVKDDILNQLKNCPNYLMHQNYGYLCAENIVPKLEKGMVGFEDYAINTNSNYWINEEDWVPNC